MTDVVGKTALCTKLNCWLKLLYSDQKKKNPGYVDMRLLFSSSDLLITCLVHVDDG